MKKKLALFMLVVLLAGPAQAGCLKNGQNDDPWPEFRRVDCGAVHSYIVRWEILKRMLANHGKSLSEEEEKKLGAAHYIYDAVCREA